MQHRGATEQLDRPGPEGPEAGVLPDATHLEDRGRSGELRPAHEDVAREAGAVVPTDVRAPDREAAHARGLGHPDRRPKSGEGPGLVARPHAVQFPDRLRSRRTVDRRDVGPTTPQLGERLAREDGRVEVVHERAGPGGEGVGLVVELVASISLEPVDAERQRSPEPAPPDRRGAAVRQIDRPLELVALAQRAVGEAGSGAVFPSREVRRHPQHHLHPSLAQRCERALRIGEPNRIERQRAEAPVLLPGVVDDHPAERDTGPAQAGRVVEQLRAARDLVAPLDQGELRRRRQPRPPHGGRVRRDDLCGRARIHLVGESAGP